MKTNKRWFMKRTRIGGVGCKNHKKYIKRKARVRRLADYMARNNIININVANKRR